MRPCASCPPPRLLPFSLSRFPPPLFVEPDVTVTLDLLQNPKTGERIVDVIRVSPHAIPRETMAEASTQLVKAYDLKRKAQSQADKKDYLGAVSFCQKSLELHPANAEVHSLLGVYYYRLNRLDKAKSSLQHAIDLRPDCYASWTRMGVVHDTLGNFKHAARCHKKALAIKSEFAVAAWNLGTTYLALGQMDLGQAALEQAYRLDPQIMKRTLTFISADFSDAVLAWRSFFIARMCAADHRVDDALAFLDSAFGHGFKDFDRISKDGQFQSIVQDERFHKLVSGARAGRGS
jgi:tetratricopeptide (TPR) repeat protein